MARPVTYRESIAGTMKWALENHANSFIYGLGVADPGGIFGTTTGLAENFGADRVFNTPICEESMVGFSVGASLGGLYPINVHIRNDFLLLAMNQIVNSIAKYRSMYGGLFELPLLIRAVIGRSWGQGAQHSQSLHALFSHIPGLKVIMPATSSRLRHSYQNLIQSYRGPVISLEHRLLFDLEFNDEPFGGNFTDSQVLKEGSELTLISLSHQVIQCLHAARELEKLGFSIEVIDLHSPSHFSKHMVEQSLRKTQRLIVVDPGWMKYGVAGEVAKLVLENGMTLRSCEFMGWPETPCPTSHALEKYFYVQTVDIARSCMRALGKDVELMPELFLLDHRKFRGPF